VLEGARNLVAGRGYIVLDAPPLDPRVVEEANPAPVGKPIGPYFFRLSKAIDYVVDQAISHPTKTDGWCVVRIERKQSPRVVWPNATGDDDGEGSRVPRRPHRPTGSGAAALPIPDEPGLA
jgi:hypothetical protein